MGSRGASAAAHCKTITRNATTCIEAIASLLSGLSLDWRNEHHAAITCNRACDLEQIDEIGLGPVEQKYISILKDGPQRLNVIATMLGLPSRTIAQVTEPFLIRAGLVVKDDQGGDN